MSIKKNKKQKIICACVSYVSVVLVIAIISIAALVASINIPTFHLDGAFQTASGLFRLNSGYFPGRDFYPYLGIGPLFVIFPIYKIVGGDLAATVFAAQFLTMFLGWLAVSILWHFLLQPERVAYSLVGGALVFFGANLIAQQLPFQNVFVFATEPGNSLRFIRTALPYLVALATYFLIRRVRNSNRRSLLVGFTLGGALLWSNDFALPTFCFFLLFNFCYLYCSERKTWKRCAVLMTATALFSWLVLLFIVTAGHPLELLKFNFVDVAGDQWWYFGPYGFTTRVFDVSHFFRLFSEENYFPLLVLLFFIFTAIREKSIEYFLILFVGIVLFAGGSLASVGGHLGGYFTGFCFWGVAASIIFFLKFVVIRTNSHILFFPVFLLMLAFSLLVFIAVPGWIDYKKNLASAMSDPAKFYVSELGGYLDMTYRDYVFYARQHRDYIAVEDYWGLWNSLNNSFPPMPVDSVIHALGSVREISKTSLKNVDVIITTRYLTSPVWQPWSLSQNFWFYEDLISHWEPSFISPTTVVWKRTDPRSAYEPVECQISLEKDNITLHPAHIGFYRVVLTYSSSSSSLAGGRYLLMFKNNISYGADADGFLSLPPGKHEVTFPVLITEENVGEFYFKSVGEAAVNIRACTAERILYRNKELLYERNPEDFFLTDGNWNYGIARRWAGFFTKNTVENRTKYKNGKAVMFVNGESRKIISVIENGPYLNVGVEGEILHAKDVGVPSKFEVLE